MPCPLGQQCTVGLQHRLQFPPKSTTDMGHDHAHLVQRDAKQGCQPRAYDIGPLSTGPQRQFALNKLRDRYVRLERNVLSKTPQRLRGRMAREVSRIFDAPSAGEAKARLEQLKLGLGKQLPEAMACLVAGFAAATQFYAFPKAHWRRIRSTNGLERLHGEIKRRIRVVGAFPDRASALRLITAVALHVTSIWGDRRYLDLSKEITRKAA